MRRRAVWVFLAALAVLATLVPFHFAAAETGDIVFTRPSSGASEAAEYPPATFPHFVHRIQFKCFVCHESIFQMKAGANAVSMDAIQEGKFCGNCHNDKTAFGTTFESCQRCHRP